MMLILSLSFPVKGNGRGVKVLGRAAQVVGSCLEDVLSCCPCAPPISAHEWSFWKADHLDGKALKRLQRNPSAAVVAEIFPVYFSRLEVGRGSRKHFIVRRGWPQDSATCPISEDFFS